MLASVPSTSYRARKHAGMRLAEAQRASAPAAFSQGQSLRGECACAQHVHRALHSFGMTVDVGAYEPEHRLRCAALLIRDAIHARDPRHRFDPWAVRWYTLLHSRWYHRFVLLIAVGMMCLALNETASKGARLGAAAWALEAFGISVFIADVAIDMSVNEPRHWIQRSWPRVRLVTVLIMLLGAPRTAAWLPHVCAATLRPFRLAGVRLLCGRLAGCGDRLGSVPLLARPSVCRRCVCCACQSPSLRAPCPAARSCWWASCGRRAKLWLPASPWRPKQRTYWRCWHSMCFSLAWPATSHSARCSWPTSPTTLPVRTGRPPRAPLPVFRAVLTGCPFRSGSAVQRVRGRWLRGLLCVTGGGVLSAVCALGPWRVTSLRRTLHAVRAALSASTDALLHLRVDDGELPRRDAGGR